MNTLISASSTPKKSRGLKHPNTQTMVDEAFKALNKNKCSYRAIKHYIATSYLVDMRFILNRIKSYIRESVANGKLIQMTGHGMNGSFRLSAAAARNPKEFLRKTNRKRNIIKPNFLKKKNKLVSKPAITYLTEPMRRRTSLTRPSTKQSVRKLGRSPMPKDVKKIGFDSADKNNNLPSTSSDAIQKRTTRNNCFKLSHMF